MTPPTATLADGSTVSFWTREAVLDRLQEAARTLKALPAHGCFPGGNKAAWPEVVRSFWEVWNVLDDGGRTRLGRERNHVRPRPSSQAIDQMDEALTWLAWVRDRRHVRVLWGLALGLKPGRLAQEAGVHRSTIASWKSEALAAIVQQLNVS